jgi:ribonuclease E
VQMTRKKLGLGLLESFSENCETCAGRGIIIHHDPLMAHKQTPQEPVQGQGRRRGGKGQQEHGGGNGNGGNGGGRGNGGGQAQQQQQRTPAASTHSITDDARSALAKIATSTIQTVNDAIDRVEDVVRTPDEVEAATAARPASEAAPAEEQPRGDRPRRSRGGRGRASSAAAEAPERTEAPEPAVTEPTVHAEDPTPADAAVEEPALSTLEPREAIRLEPVQILDIPVASARTAPRRVSSADAEQLLGSVLDALPQPKEPGQGRSRSRRVSTATLTTPTPTPADDAS